MQISKRTCLFTSVISTFSLPEIFLQTRLPQLQYSNVIAGKKTKKKPPSRRIIPANLLQTTAACWSAVLKWMHAPVARLSVCELQSRSAVDAQIFCVERQTSRIRVVNTHFSPPANYAQTSRRTCMDSR